MSSSAPNWQTLYRIPDLPGSRYQVMLNAVETEAIEFRVDARMVDRAPAVELLVTTAGIDVSDVTDGRTHVSVDQFDRPQCRLRPLSYAFQTKCWRALDKPQTLLIKKAQTTTLRKRLLEWGAPHAPDSDLFPCKLGISGLIVEGAPGQLRRVLTTKRAAKMAVFSGARHTSFSGGVDMADIPSDGNSLATVLQRAAARECEEEIAVLFEEQDVVVLGIWRDLQRLSAQAFAVVFVDDITTLKVRLSEEVDAFYIDEFSELLQACRNDPDFGSSELRYLIDTLRRLERLK